MADTPKTPVNYTLSDKGKQAIADHAKVAAHLHRAKRLVEDPSCDVKALDKECADCCSKETKELTESLQGVVRQLNEVLGGLKEDQELKLVVGSHTVTVDSQAGVDEAVEALVSVNHTAKLKPQLRYYDKVLEMRDMLSSREKGIAAGTAQPFTDLDMARLMTLNEDIRQAGEEIGIDKAKLKVDAYRFELRAYDSRLKGRKNPSSYEERSIGDDQRRIALLKEWMKKEEQAMAAKKPPTVTLEREAAPPPATLPPPRVIESPQAPSPRPVTGGMQSSLDIPGAQVAVVSRKDGVFAAAASQVQAILSGDIEVASDFNRTPGKTRSKALAV